MTLSQNGFDANLLIYNFMLNYGREYSSKNDKISQSEVKFLMVVTTVISVIVVSTASIIVRLILVRIVVVVAETKVSAIISPIVAAVLAIVVVVRDVVATVVVVLLSVIPILVVLLYSILSVSMVIWRSFVLVFPMLSFHASTPIIYLVVSDVDCPFTFAVFSQLMVGEHSILVLILEAIEMRTFFSTIHVKRFGNAFHLLQIAIVKIVPEFCIVCLFAHDDPTVLGLVPTVGAPLAFLAASGRTVLRLKFDYA
jgi:hypothetical protein